MPSILWERRIWKELEQNYDESALTYDIYNELREFSFIRSISDEITNWNSLYIRIYV